ncbi:anti-sigma factor [Thioclava sp. BHET1]|nr:anti-sigma factor [Thioclava sp. BHET1]
MSTEPPLSPEDGDDLFAAEYVLGVLPLPERLAAEGRLRAEPEFAARIVRWTTHLAPLNADYPEIPAPNLLPAIEARLFGQPRRAAPRRWILAGLGATAALAALGIFLGQPRAPRLLSAEIAASGGALLFRARYDAATGLVTITRLKGAGPDAAHDYELWIIAPGGAPAPAGLVSAARREIAVPKLLPGYTLAVSLEPSGGSPNGSPTEVLGAGVLSQA